MALYFDTFPEISYNGETIKNITLRARVMESFKKTSTNFYPYTLKDGDTADAVAYDYYKDPNYSWIVYYCNDIIDPYYDWHMSSVNFENFIDNKYGNSTVASQTILYYKKLPQDYYVHNVTNEYKLYSEYNAATDGYAWTRVTIDDEIKLSPDSIDIQGLNVNDYEAIDAYTEELRLNDEKRYIKLLDRRLVPAVEKQLRDLLNG